MQERVNPFAPMIPGVVSILAATIVIHFSSPVRADSACIEQPSPPAAEGTRWSLHYDRARGRKCWVLVDAPTNGHDAAAAQSSAAATPALQSLSSQIASLLGNLTGASANVTPQATASQISPPSRKPQGTANAGKADGGGYADQKSSGEGHAAKRASSGLSQGERQALFEEFLRWQTQESVGTLIPSPASR